MKLARQSTMVVVAVPLIGAALAAGVTDEVLDPQASAVAVARTGRISGPEAAPVTAPLAGLFAATSENPASGTPRPAPAPATPAPSARRPVPIPARLPGAAAHRRDFLISADGTLSAPVGVYSDCTGRSPLSRMEAAIDTCYPAPVYFLGHNLGVFSPLMHMGVGSLITYYDSDGHAHPWRVVFIHDGWPIGPGRPAPAEPDVVAQFQTCISRDGSDARVVDVVNA
jgi:hypothetical protein